MSCGCNNGIPDDRFDHMRYMRQFPTHQYCSCHHDEPLFMPFQPPPWMGPCMPPPPRQAGPWEYTPSHMYPAPPPCGGYGLPHIPPPYQCQCHSAGLCPHADDRKDEHSAFFHSLKAGGGAGGYCRCCCFSGFRRCPSHYRNYAGCEWRTLYELNRL